MRHLIPFLILVAGCIVPERNIDDTRVVGTLSIPPTRARETGDGPNANPFLPIAMDPLHYGYREWNGSLLNETDIDHWSLVTPIARTAENPLAVDITLSDLAATATISVLNLEDVDPINGPRVVSTETFTGWTLHSFEAQANIQYALRISEGSAANLIYSCFALGQHPDDAGILVGAYSGTKPDDRGNLLAGSNAKPWVEVEGHSFESWYEMLFVREFLTNEDGDVESIDDSIRSAYIWAGSWSNLSQGLPAGTWHSKSPIPVDLKKKGKSQQEGTPPGGAAEADTGGGEVRGEPLISDVPLYPTVEVPEPVVIDRIAPVAIGQTWPETEPNDTDIAAGLTDGTGAQDLGTLTGVGYVDVVENGTLISDGYDYWGSDIDTFKFQVPEPMILSFKLSWAEAALDLDVLLVDADGKTLDQGFYGFPEIPEDGTVVLTPGKDYYLGVMLWVGPGVANQPVPYELTLEQLPE